MIEAPIDIGVDLDHNAETIYFVVDRFFDNVDLSTMTCVVQYENANPDKKKAGFYYAVPFFDISGPSVPENQMIFQWAIDGAATAYPGKLTFAIQFYRTSVIELDDANNKPVKYYRYDYMLNTLPATTIVKHGMDMEAFTENYLFEANEAKRIFDEIAKANAKAPLYWIDLSDYDPLESLFKENDYPENTINKNDMIASEIERTHT